MSILNLNGPEGHFPRPKRGAKIWMGIGLIIAVLGVGSTLASTITINQGTTTEFGQGVQRTVYCGGNQTITLVPISGFINNSESNSSSAPLASASPTTSATPSSSATPSNNSAPISSASPPGTFYLSGIKVTDIPNSCSGKDFVFTVYDKSGSSTPVVISTLGGVQVITPTVWWVHGSEYGGILSLSRDINVPATSLAELHNIEQDGDKGGFIISFLDQSGTTHAAIDDISRIVVETQDDTFGHSEHVDHHVALSQLQS